MGNNLYNLFNGNNGVNNPIINMMGGYQQFMNNFSQFANQFRQQNGGSPENIVRQLMNSGKMSQSQFNQFAEIANNIIGRRN